MCQPLCATCVLALRCAAGDFQDLTSFFRLAKTLVPSGKVAWEGSNNTLDFGGINRYSYVELLESPRPGTTPSTQNSLPLALLKVSGAWQPGGLAGLVAASCPVPAGRGLGPSWAAGSHPW